MKKYLPVLLFSLLAYTGVYAQFPTNASQTFYVCDTANTQNTVSAFADGNGGTYSFWIDKRYGSAGTDIYGQHLDSLGFAKWPVNGKNFVSTSGKEIWIMKAIPWQSGFLIAWVQGAFGVGGDTLFCNYYNINGVSQWAHPTLAANRQLPNFTGVDYGNLDLYPTVKGATVTSELEPSGGNDVFCFNQIDFTGKLAWPLDSVTYTDGGNYYFATGDDHHDGFYVAGSTGGLGTHIYVGHFDKNGVLTIATPVDVSTVAGGRGNDAWYVIADTAGNGYVVWDNGTLVSIAKVTSSGTLPWGGGGAKTICSAAGSRTETYGIMYNDTIYALWDDARPGAANQFSIYMQKLDTSGNMFWTPNGIKLSNLPAYLPYPKLVKTGKEVVAALELNNRFSGQEINPDSTVVWQPNGAPVNINNNPFYGDYVLVSTGGGNVVAIWSDNSNIMAARVRPDGTLTGVAQLNNRAAGDAEIYPNPAVNNFTVLIPQPLPASVTINIYNSLGQLVQQKQFAGNNNSGAIIMNTDNLSTGIYFVKVSGENYYSSSKICVAKK